MSDHSPTEEFSNEINTDTVNTTDVQEESTKTNDLVDAQKNEQMNADPAQDLIQQTPDEEQPNQEEPISEDNESESKVKVAVDEENDKDANDQQNDISDVEANNQETMKDVEGDNQEAVNDGEANNEETIKDVGGDNQETVNDVEVNNEQTMKDVEGDNQEAVNDVDVNNEETIKDVAGDNQEAVNDVEVNNEETMKDVEGDNQEAVNDVEVNNEETMKDVEGDNKEAVNDVEVINEETMKDVEGDNEEAVNGVGANNEETMKDVEGDNKEAVNDGEANNEETMKDAEGDNKEAVNDGEANNEETMKDVEGDKQEAVNDVEVNNQETIKDVEADNQEAVNDVGANNQGDMNDIEDANQTVLNDIEYNNQEAINDVKVNTQDGKNDVEVDKQEECNGNVENELLENAVNEKIEVNCEDAQRIESNRSTDDESNKKDIPKVDSKTTGNHFSKGGDTNKAYCLTCEKVAYPLEQFRTKLGIYHKNCFKCTKCNKPLTPANYSFNNDKPYCTPHYLELFKKRGKYDDSEDLIVENNEQAVAKEQLINEAGDDLPAPESTKSLIANIESRTYNVTVSGNRDHPENLPTENITKKLAEKFAAMSKPQIGSTTERAAPIKLINGNGVHHNRTNETNGAHYSENEPKQLDKDVVRADQPLDDNRPKQGTAKMMAQLFNQEIA